MRNSLIVMVKLPRPGRVKTRLAPALGTTGAAWWYRHQCAALLRRLEDPRWEMTLAVAPDAEGMTARAWPTHLSRMPQGPGDLGQRMRRLLRIAPAGKVLVVGSDIPALGRAQVARAFASLGAADAVIGPARDGGYWGVGLKRRQAVAPRLFDGVRWSGPHARADTLAGMRGLRVALVDMLDDVDEAADLPAVPGSDRARR